MPTQFLKRWLYTINEGKFTMEDIEKDFDGFIKMFSWNYIQRQIITAEQITVTDEEAAAEAKDLAAMQFAQRIGNFAPTFRSRFHRRRIYA